MKYFKFFFLIVFFYCNGTEAKSTERDRIEPWNNSLAYDGGGYWKVRVPVVVINKSKDDLQGKQISVTLSDQDGTSSLVGTLVSGLRVSSEIGEEYLFELRNSDKKRKRNGTLTHGDIITFSVEARTDSTAIVFLYGENPSAWLPPDLNGFSDDPERSKRAVNEWLEVRGDDVEPTDGIHVEIQHSEFRELTIQQVDSSWTQGINWKYRVPIQIRNYSQSDIKAGVNTINTRHVFNRFGKLFGYEVKPAICLIDPVDPDHPIDLSGSLTESLRVMVSVSALTKKTLWLYVSENPNASIQSRYVEMFSGIHDDPELDIRAGEFEAREKPDWPITAWAVDPLIKVFRQDIVPENPSKDIKIYAARNAYKSFQIALRSVKDMNASIRITALKNINGEELPPPEIYKVGYVPVDSPVRYFRTPKISDYIRFYPDGSGSDGWADWWPDPLIPVKNSFNCLMKGGSTQPVWFDLIVPENTSPGTYGGFVIITSPAREIQIPVTLKVWNLVLPEKRNIPAIYDLRIGPGKNPFIDKMSNERDWCRFLAKFNVSPGLLAQPTFTYEGGKVQMETKEFDEVAHFFIEELNNTMLYTPGFFYSVGWYSGAKPIFDLQPFSPEYVIAWKSAYRLFVDHITKKGWRSNFVLYLSDEPRVPRAYNAIAAVADMAKVIAPDVPIYVSSWEYIEEIAGHITAWGIGAQGQFPANLIEERRKAGDRFIYTTDGQQCMDTPFPATERLMPWFCFKYGVDAFEFWGSTWWTFNPWKYGWHAFVREGGGAEEVKNPVRYPNGDGYIAYPGDEVNIVGPVPSIRLLAIREGVDDYEVFNALQPFAENGNRDAQEVLEVVRSLVIKPHYGGVRSTSFMPLPLEVSKARIAAGEVLDRLME